MFELHVGQALRRPAPGDQRHLPFAEVVLAVRCGTPERIPEPQFDRRLGISVPLIVLDPLEASAPAKLRRALSHFDEAHKRRI